MKKSELSIVGMENLDPPAIVQPADDVGGVVRREVLRLRQQVDLDHWALARALTEIHNGSLFMAWGFRDWKSYVEQEADVSMRTVVYMVATENWLESMPAEAQAWARGLGWTKTRMLVNVVTPQNWIEWRARVEGLSVAQMDALLHAEPEAEDGEAPAREAAEGADDALKPWKVQLSRAQKENVERALEHAAGAVGGSVEDRRGYLLDLVCTDYLGSNGCYRDVGEFLTRLAAATGLRLLAYSATEDAVVFGIDLLEEMGARADAEEAARLAAEAADGADA